MNTLADCSNLLDAARRATLVAALTPVSIEPHRILHMHGYRDLPRVRSRVREAAIEMATLADRIQQARVSLRCRAFRWADAGTVVFEGGGRLSCAAFGHYLRDCDELVVFALSAGADFDARIAQFIAASEPVNALFLNTAGWLCVERVTRELARAVRAAAIAEARRVTRRMGPGYSYHVAGQHSIWELSEQRELFALLEGPHCAVRVLESGGMQPQMSRSGLFGLSSCSVPQAPASAANRQSRSGF